MAPEVWKCSPFYLSDLPLNDGQIPNQGGVPELNWNMKSKLTSACNPRDSGWCVSANQRARRTINCDVIGDKNEPAFLFSRVSFAIEVWHFHLIPENVGKCGFYFY